MSVENLEETIRTAYADWIAHQEVSVRLNQQQMMMAIAEVLGTITLDEQGIRTNDAGRMLVEAGTGIGKTLAYLLGALPIAQAFNKKLVVSTATVTLQDQLINKTLPEIQKYTGLRCDYVLAKGQQRYCCLRRLEEKMQGRSPQSLLPPDLIGLESEFSAQQAKPIYDKMLKSFSEETWDGDKDHWPDRDIAPGIWHPVAVDRKDCIGANCKFFSECPYFKARGQLKTVDVIVTNHDLLVSDLNIGGGGVLLPAPQDSIYIIDEGHQLPERTLNHLRDQLDIQEAMSCVKNITDVFDGLRKNANKPIVPEAVVNEYATCAENLAGGLVELRSIVKDVFLAQGEPNEQVLRFPQGIVPEPLKSKTAELYKWAAGVYRFINQLQQRLQDAADEESTQIPARLATAYLPVVNLLETRAFTIQKLLYDYADSTVALEEATEEATDVRARWLQTIPVKGQADDYRLNASPILAASFLKSTLWADACGVIVTSATLQALGNFDYFRLHSGFDGTESDRCFASPFAYQERSVLMLPKEARDGNEHPGHTDSIIQLLPKLIEPAVGTLVLYSSLEQLKTVRDALPEEHREQILAQNDYSRSEVLRRHRERVDAGQTSVLFGLVSFAEGVDLPGHYCQHVILVKLSFPVPSEPIHASLTEWLEIRGENAFWKASLPKACVRLVQGAGRLLRDESDFGQITLLDRRIVSRRYGPALVAALPPSRRLFGRQAQVVQSTQKEMGGNENLSTDSSFNR